MASSEANRCGARPSRFSPVGSRGSACWPYSCSNTARSITCPSVNPSVARPRPVHRPGGSPPLSAGARQYSSAGVTALAASAVPISRHGYDASNPGLISSTTAIGGALDQDHLLMPGCEDCELCNGDLDHL